MPRRHGVTRAERTAAFRRNHFAKRIALRFLDSMPRWRARRVLKTSGREVSSRKEAKMSSQDRIPQTLTTMEAGFTLHEGKELQEEFWRRQERMGRGPAK